MEPWQYYYECSGNIWILWIKIVGLTVPKGKVKCGNDILKMISTRANYLKKKLHSIFCPQKSLTSDFSAPY